MHQNSGRRAGAVCEHLLRPPRHPCDERARNRSGPDRLCLSPADANQHKAKPTHFRPRRTQRPAHMTEFNGGQSERVGDHRMNNNTNTSGVGEVTCIVDRRGKCDERTPAQAEMARNKLVWPEKPSPSADVCTRETGAHLRPSQPRGCLGNVETPPGVRGQKSKLNVARLATVL